MQEQMNARIASIWETHLGGNTDTLAPLNFPQLEQKDVLFVGMNPSFDIRKMKSWFRKNGWNDDPCTYYLWINRNLICPEREELTRAHFQKNHPFFRQHHSLIESLGGPSWIHLDLFPYRQTNQKEFIAFREANQDFHSECLEVFDTAVNIVRPKLILIWNARASTEFLARHPAEFDPIIGTHRLCGPVMERGIPVFASSMLTGQRALDVHSRERLFWHIRKVYDAL